MISLLAAEMASAMKTMASARSAFAGQQMAFKPAAATARPLPVSRVVQVEAAKRCELTGTKRNKANQVCFSNKKSRKWQEPNLQHKMVYWPEGQRWVHLRITTRAIKTIEKNGLQAMAKEAGLDLWKLPFQDARPERLQYLAENKGKVPVAENPRCEAQGAIQCTIGRQLTASGQGARHGGTGVAARAATCMGGAMPATNTRPAGGCCGKARNSAQLSLVAPCHSASSSQQGDLEGGCTVQESSWP